MEEKMKGSQIMKIVLSMLVITSLAGCAMFNKNEVIHTRTTTLGQELADLHNAKESGALSEEEYKTLKNKMLKTNSSEPSGCCAE
jgi:hypothetical protein